jgi:hypothetical protein
MVRQTNFFCWQSCQLLLSVVDTVVGTTCTWTFPRMDDGSPIFWALLRWSQGTPLARDVSLWDKEGRRRFWMTRECLQRQYLKLRLGRWHPLFITVVLRCCIQYYSRIETERSSVLYLRLLNSNTWILQRILRARTFFDNVTSNAVMLTSTILS